MLGDPPGWLTDWADRPVAPRSDKGDFFSTKPQLPEYLRSIKGKAAQHAQGSLGLTWTRANVEKLRSALSFIPADDRSLWIDMGLALWQLGWDRSDGTSVGFDLWNEYSAKCTEKYSLRACEEAWESFGHSSYDGPRITEDSIFYHARQRGWKDYNQLNGHASAEGSGLSGLTSGATTADAEAPTESNASEKFAGSPLPVIQVVGGGLSSEASAGEEAVIRAGYPVYSRGGALVRPVVEEVDATRGRRTKIAQLARVDLSYMIDLLCRSATWMRYDGRKKTLARIDPPSNIAQIILCRRGEWAFEPVVGVITTPTLRPDGSLLIHAGYDPKTRLVLTDPPWMPNIPEHPTRDDALTALALLDGLLDEFPFADDSASRSVALSCLITPVVRGAFSVAPMHAACAPTAGTGKSFLFDIAAAISIGHPCPVMAVGRNEEETEKRLGAAVLSGQPIINIDNVNGELGGDALCQIIERPIVEIRILGKSERVRIDSRSTVFATGNNLRVVGDMTCRVVQCTLDARQERPELRQFDRDPVAEVLADRGRYVAAALTIVRAYVVAGRPSVVGPLSSFEGWSEMVRSPLVWLGQTDPVATMEAARRDDPHLQAIEAVFAALTGLMGCRQQNAMSAAQIIEFAEKTVPGPNGNQLQYPGLNEALMAVAAPRGRLDARELGKWLSRHKGRIIRNVRLERQADEHGHAARWWLVNCG